jgi:hypothetical protein
MVFFLCNEHLSLRCGKRVRATMTRKGQQRLLWRAVRVWKHLTIQLIFEIAVEWLVRVNATPHIFFDFF